MSYVNFNSSLSIIDTNNHSLNCLRRITRNTDVNLSVWNFGKWLNHKRHETEEMTRRPISDPRRPWVGGKHYTYKTPTIRSY